MKKRALGIVAASAFAIAAIGAPVAAGGHPPSAGNSDQSLPAAACHGHIISSLASNIGAGGTASHLPPGAMGDVNKFVSFICDVVHSED